MRTFADGSTSWLSSKLHQMDFDQLHLCFHHGGDGDDCHEVTGYPFNALASWRVSKEISGKTS